MIDILNNNLNVQLVIKVEVEWFDTPKPDISHLETKDRRNIIRLLEYENNQWKMLSIVVKASYGVLKSKHTLHNMPSDFGEDTKEELILDCRSKAMASLMPKIQERLLMNPTVIKEEGKPIMKWKMPSII